MANWAFTEYVIEGPRETLERIENAILNPNCPEGASEDWEGGVLRALGFEWKENSPDGTGKYMRGFIYKDSIRLEEDTLIFDAEEAWGITDFYEVLEENLPEIDVYWYVEEPGEGIYSTNDTTGKHFPARYFVEISFNDEFHSNYFNTNEEVYKWIADILKVESITEEDIKTFNNSEEDIKTSNNSKKDEEGIRNYITIHEIEVCK